MGILHYDILTFCKLLPQDCALGLAVDVKDHFDINLYCDLLGQNLFFLSGRYRFLPGGGPSVCGGRIFWGGQRGEPVFFSAPNGRAECFEGQIGETARFIIYVYEMLGQWARIFSQSKRGTRILRHM